MDNISTKNDVPASSFFPSLKDWLRKKKIGFHIFLNIAKFG
jgi:hypothetical protein